MCAIAGSHNETEVPEMLALMRHRAPDGCGHTTTNGFTLGMGRLKIIDLISPGLCPIEMDGLTLVFNGEIFNYIELREELEKEGYKFTTSSDSEVLLRAYRAYGEACLDKLNWMGAFAISDGKRVFLARDIAGEKPLYYTDQPFRFASEAKALNFDCKEFPPAHCAFYDIETKDFGMWRWWNIPQATRQISLAKAVEELDILLEDAVKIRTRSHVPYGLYKSGGVDSTLISTYHDFDHKFTYTDGDYSKEFKNVFPKILWHLDYPVKTFSPFGLWKLAEQARTNEVKVVLSGEGADELFGGYVRFVPNEFNRKAQEAFPSYKALFPYRDMMREEFQGNMQELLRMGDRMASAHGVENRCPFLDRRVIEFAFSLPVELKINGYDTKIVLRELLKKRMPEYKFEEKHGLYCSVNKWISSSDKFDKTAYIRYQEELYARTKAVRNKN